jgi:hypothetical protein
MSYCSDLLLTEFQHRCFFSATHPHPLLHLWGLWCDTLASLSGRWVFWAEPGRGFSIKVPWSIRDSQECLNGSAQPSDRVEEGEWSGCTLGLGTVLTLSLYCWKLEGELHSLFLPLWEMPYEKGKRLREKIASTYSWCMCWQVFSKCWLIPPLQQSCKAVRTYPVL